MRAEENSRNMLQIMTLLPAMRTERKMNRENRQKKAKREKLSNKTKSQSEINNVLAEAN
jgi:hypothetical protein